MGILVVQKNQPTVISLLLVNQISGEPREGLTSTDVVVEFARSNENSFTPKTLNPGDFVDLGNGAYRLAINSSETNVAGTSIYVVKGAPALAPAIRDFVTELVVAQADTSVEVLASLEFSQYAAGAMTLVLLNEIGGEPREGLTAANIEVELAKAGSSSFTAKTLQLSDLQGLGNGVYRLVLNNEDTDTLGDLLVSVNGVGSLLPQIRDFLGQVRVVDAPIVPTSAPALPTCVVTGTILDAEGNPVVNTPVIAQTARVPDILMNTGISSSIVSTVTDVNGFFSLRLIRGVTVEFFVPNMNFRQTVVVPNLGTVDLFSIP